MKPQEKFYTGRELIAHAVAVDEFQGGKYIKSHEVDKDKGVESNFKLMLGLLHTPKDSKVIIDDTHFEMADSIIEYFEGLIFKAMERELSDFEKKITQLIKSDNISLSGRDDRLPIVGSLPNIYRNNVKHDDWAERERSLRKISTFEGELKKRGKFAGEIVMARFMNRSNSMLVAILTADDNIVKFFYDLHRSGSHRDMFKEGDNISLSGYVKSHDTSKYSKCKETFLNRVSLDTQEDK
jgi:hypothetical protein